MDIKEAFIQLFTDDPVNWVKWVIVFVVLILGYRFSIPLYEKVSYRFSFDYKRDIARARGHIIRATLLYRHKTGDVWKYDWNARYEYSIDGKTRTYGTFFRNPNTPPLVLYLYYVDNPRHLFAMEDNSIGKTFGNFCSSLITLFFTVLPWILACITTAVLQIPLPQ